MKRVLRILIDIFQPEGIDWMNFALSRNNQYTFHHIVEKSNGGAKDIDNGAILTRKAHSLLHMLENSCPEAYDDLQAVFHRINDTKRPVTKEIIFEVDKILYNVVNKEKYVFKQDLNLSPFLSPYYKGRQIVKSLKNHRAR